MTARASNLSVPTTSLRAMRADALHRLLLKSRSRVSVTGDIPRLSELLNWPSEQIQVAIGDLVAAGLLVDDEHGHIHVRPLAEATARRAGARADHPKLEGLRGLEKRPGNKSRAASVNAPHERRVTTKQEPHGSRERGA